MCNNGEHKDSEEKINRIGIKDELKHVGEEFKQQQEEITKEVKTKVKSLGIIKLVILAVLLAGTVLSFVFYDKIFGSDNVFLPSEGRSDFLNGFLGIMPPFIKSVQIVSITLFAVTVLLGFIRRFFGKKTQRSKTVTLLICNLIKWITTVVLVIVVLAVWGVNTGALITGAGVITLVVGLGMQSLISDVVAGLFIVFENDFNVGDIITVGDFRGTVVSIGIRTTKLEALGNVKIINNSDIRGVLNQTRKESTAFAEISVSYGADLPRVEEVINENLKSVEVEDAIGEVKYEGVKSLGSSGILLLFSAQCYEGNVAKVTRRMNRELKVMFDNNGIEIPFDQIVVHTDGDLN